MAIKSRIRLNQVQDEVGDLAVAGGGQHGAEQNLQDVLLNLSDYLERRFGIDKLSGSQASADKYGNLFSEQADEGGAIVYATDRSADLVIRHNNSSQAIDVDSAGTIDMDSVGVFNAASAAAGDSEGAIADVADNAVYIQASAGGIGLDSGTDMNLVAGSDFFLDAVDNIAVESSAGSITVGSELADEQSIVLGEQGSVMVEMNKSATSDNEQLILSSAGTGTAAAQADYQDASLAMNASGGIAMNATLNFGAFSAGDMHLESSAGDHFFGATVASTKKIQLGETTETNLGHVKLTRAATASNSTIDVSSQGKATLKSIANTSVVDPNTPGDAALSIHAVAGGIGIESEMSDNMAIVLNATDGGVQAYANSTQSWSLLDADSGSEEASMYLEASGALHIGSSSTTATQGSFVLKAGGAATTEATVSALTATYGSSDLADVIDELAGADQPDLICFDDANRDGWSFKDGIPLSLHSGDWTDFEDAFGEVSLLRAMVLSGAGAADSFYHEIEIADATNLGDTNGGADIYAETLADNLTIANITNGGTVVISDDTEALVSSVPQMSASTSLAELKERIQVFCNGQRLALRGDFDVAISANATREIELSMNFALETGDVLIIKC